MDALWVDVHPCDFAFSLPLMFDMAAEQTFEIAPVGTVLCVFNFGCNLVSVIALLLPASSLFLWIKYDGMFVLCDGPRVEFVVLTLSVFHVVRIHVMWLPSQLGGHRHYICGMGGIVVEFAYLVAKIRTRHARGCRQEFFIRRTAKFRQFLIGHGLARRGMFSSNVQ